MISRADSQKVDEPDVFGLRWKRERQNGRMRLHDRFSKEKWMRLRKYPLAVDPQRVGTYEAASKSGAGFFYDDVLEYRVWLHPERGATPLNGDKDYYLAFAQYERAQAFSKITTGSKEPLVLVRQREWIDEPRPGEYHPEQGERITEWQVKWLPTSKRTATSVRDFMAHPTPAPANE